MAARHRCTTGPQADKLILVGGPLGYPVHIVCLPPPMCVAGSIVSWWSTSGVRMTEMMTCDWSMIVDVFTCWFVKLLHIALLIYLIFSAMFISCTRRFHSTDTEQKLAPENGVSVWRRFLERVMGLRHYVSSQQYNSYQQAGTVETAAGRRNVEHQLTTVDSDQLNVQCRTTDHHVAVSDVTRHIIQ